MADPGVADADQSRPPGPDEQRHGADRVGLGKRADRHAIPGGRLGSATRNARHTVARVGHVLQRDGRPARRPPFINGGTLQYDPFFGQPRSAVFDLATGLFTRRAEHGARPLVPRPRPRSGDGRVMTFSGLTETGGTNTSVEILHSGCRMERRSRRRLDTTALSAHAPAAGRHRVVFGLGHRLARLQSDDQNVVRRHRDDQLRRHAPTYGTSVLLPLTPANAYKPRVVIMGGGNPATPTTELIDMSAATPKWVTGPPMSQPRIEMNATILPNGKVLAVGGSTNDEDVTTASLNADLYDPATNTFSSAGANLYPRVYHSGSLLLPDATVLLIGGNPVRGTYETRTEIYSPAYLFNANGSPAARPTITAVTPSAFSYGGTFQVQTTDAANIASVVAGPPRRADARVRHGPATRRTRLHDGHRRAERDGATQREHRTARLLHAVRP